MSAFLESVIESPAVPLGLSDREFFEWLKEFVLIKLPRDVGGKGVCGLYLATSDLGAASSVEFWTDALTNGYAFANPRNFPMTLSNAMASMIAIEMGITGPNYTFVGGGDVHRDAYIQTLLDVESATVERCIIVSFPPLTTKSNEQSIVASVLSSTKQSALASVSLCTKNSVENSIAMNLDNALANLTYGNKQAVKFRVETDVKMDILIER